MFILCHVKQKTILVYQVSQIKTFCQMQKNKNKTKNINKKEMKQFHDFIIVLSTIGFIFLIILLSLHRSLEQIEVVTAGKLSYI